MTMNYKVFQVFCYLAIITLCSACERESDNYADYYHLIRKSKKFSKENKPHKALEVFNLATEKVSYVHIRNYMYAAFEAKKIDSCDLALQYLSKAIIQGYNHDSPHLSEEEFLSNFFSCSSKSKTNKDLEVSLLNMLKKPNRSFNIKLKETLDSLYIVDQKVRTEGYSSDYMKKVDSSNFFLLKKLIDRHGFPDERIVGANTAENIFYVLLHYDDDHNNIILKDILKEALERGQISPQNYAWIIDRRLAWGPDKKEPYYYQMPSKKIKDLNEEEIKEIDKRRYSIGLKPLSEMDIEFTSDGGMRVNEDWTDY